MKTLIIIIFGLISFSNGFTPTPQFLEEGNWFVNNRLRVFEYLSQREFDLSSFYSDLIDWMVKTGYEVKRLSEGLEEISHVLRDIREHEVESVFTGISLGYIEFSELSLKISHLLDFAIQWIDRRTPLVRVNIEKVRLVVIRNKLEDAKQHLQSLSQDIMEYHSKTNKMTELYQRNRFIPNNLEMQVHSLEIRLNEPRYLELCHEAIQNIIQLMNGEEPVDLAVNPELNHEDNQEDNDIVMHDNDDVGEIID